MLNEERIILMTKMAAYESGEGKKDKSIGSFFRGDYMGLHVLRAVVSATVAFLLVVAVYIVYNFDSILDEIYVIDLVGMGRKFGKAYVIFVLSYSLIVYAVFTYKYRKAKQKQKRFMGQLRQLSEMYQKESKNKLQ